jgi:hypothetical protein
MLSDETKKKSVFKKKQWKKKFEPTQINLLIPQTWTQDWDNPTNKTWDQF